MTASELLPRVKRRLNLTDDARDAVIADLIEDAIGFVLAYTGRGELPTGFPAGLICEIAAGSFNLLGLEGASAHSEGGVSDTIDLLPPRIREQLNNYRVAKVG